MSDSFDTLILGAGVAGLAAARTLTQAGERVAVVEARDRTGGRIYTQRIAVAGNDALPIELGAEFIHGLPEETWQLVAQGQLATFELQGSQLVLCSDRLEVRDDAGVTAEVLQKVKARWLAVPRPADMTFAEYLQTLHLDPAARAFAAAYVEGFNAADHRVIGVAALAQQQGAEDANHADRLFRVTSGYDSIPRLLAANIGDALRLRHIIERVEWRPGAVSISGRENRREFTLTGQRAIITLPLGVLQSGAVAFEPIPAAALADAARLCMGTVVRVVLVFRLRFWEQSPISRGLGFLFTPDHRPMVWWTAAPDGAPTLTGWLGGAAAAAFLQELQSADSDALPRTCLKTLAAAFGPGSPSLQDSLLSWHWHDWQSDEFARGAYSYVPAHALEAARQLTNPVSGTLFFAGEHTDLQGEWGTVQGALRSGARAAQQLLASRAQRVSRHF